MANGINFTDIFRKDTTDTPTTSLSMTNPQYASMVGIAIAQAAAGTTPQYVKVLAPRNRRHTGRYS